MLTPRFVFLRCTILLFALMHADPAVARLANRGIPATSSTTNAAPATASNANKQTLTNSPEEVGKNTDRLLQLHIAEYQVLSARSTNWTTLQYGLATFTVAALALLIANLRLFSSGIATWAVAVLYQLVVVAHLLVLSMLFTNVRYIECDLRPAIQSLIAPVGDPALTSSVDKRSFWRYERYMQKNSPYKPISDYLLAPQSFGAFLIAVGFRRKSWSHRSDWYWLLISLGAFILSLTLTGGMITAHRAFLACAAR